jgi:hypothetical protein
MLNLRKLLIGTALCTGCISPQDTFDRFVDDKRALEDAGGNTSPDDGGGGGGGEPLKPAQLDGTYLWVISTNLAPTKPVVYEVELTAAAVPGSTDLNLTLRQRALACSDRKTPVEEFGAAQEARVAATGAYTSDPVNTVVPAEANPPLGCSSPGDSTVTFTGTIANPATEADPLAPVDFWCGKISGSALNGALPLSGDFTVTRITDPDNYPAVVINCKKDPADPL